MDTIKTQVNFKLVYNIIKILYIICNYSISLILVILII